MTHLGDQLSAYLDLQMETAPRVTVEAHLAECVECREELAVVSAVRSRLRALPLLQPPVGALELTAEVVALRPTRRVLTAAAAVAALVVGIGFGVTGNQTVPLELDSVVEQHMARASVDPGFNVIQVQAVLGR